MVGNLNKVLWFEPQRLHFMDLQPYLRKTVYFLSPLDHKTITSRFVNCTTALRGVIDPIFPMTFIHSNAWIH